MDNALKPIEDLIRAALGRRFNQVFGAPLLFTNAADKKARYAKHIENNPNQKLPFAFATLTGQSLNDANYSPQALLRRGIAGSASSDMVQTYRLRMIPAVTTYQITFLAADLAGATQFSKRWLIGVVENSLKFTITYGIVDVSIHIDMDRDVAIPPRPGGVTETDEYEIQTTLRVNGFLSKDLEKAQAAVETVTEGKVGTATEVAQAIAGQGDRTRQVFEFKRPWPNT